MSTFESKQKIKYFLTDKIATGEAHEIYRASTTGADGQKTTVAIKRIPEEMSADKDNIAIFLDEARVAAPEQRGGAADGRVRDGNRGRREWRGGLGNFTFD